MLDLFSLPISQKCNTQTFYKDNTWVKPRGISNIYMLLIGGGGNGNSVDQGGGSGAVTVWYGAAQQIPDNLVISVSTGNASNTIVNYRASNGLNALLTANGASTTTAGTAMTSNQFALSGFFQSIAGQAGGTGSVSASSTSFLSGGGTTVIGNYGYQSSGVGFFQMQPIIVGVGGSGANKGNIGCGGGATGIGGPGMVLIASW